MEGPLVSVLMPVYNAEHTIARTLDSVINQTYKNLEIVVINDHSNDETSEILELYMKRDTRIHVYTNQLSSGVAGALNYGLSLCGGKYIARMDADDVCNLKRIEKQVDYMEDNPKIGILGTAVRRIDEKNGTKIVDYCPTDSEEIRCWLLFNIQAVHPTIMFRADVIKDLKIEYPYVEAEDYDLFASLIDRVKMANLSEPLLDYYVNTSDQMTVVIKNAIRNVNNNISRRTINNTLHIDTSKYSDFIFGARGSDCVPYDIAGALDEAEKLFLEMHNNNLIYKSFNPHMLDIQLERELFGIKAFLHIGAFNEIQREFVLHNLDNGSFDFSKEFPCGRAIVYGTGSWAKRCVPETIEKMPIEVLAYCDSDENKRGGVFLGKPIISPWEINSYDYDYVFIATPLYKDEIVTFLLKNEIVPEGKIEDFCALSDLDFFSIRQKWIEEYSRNDSKPRVFLFEAPDYSNMGDHAIALAENVVIDELLGEKLIEVPLRRNAFAYEIAKKFIKPDDLILITGGGFLGSLWMNSEVLARDIVESFPNNRIIIMPQTLYWAGDSFLKKEIELSREIYSKHTGLTMCARDKVSQELMKKYYPQCKVILAPDMVMAIDWNAYITKSKRSDILLCLKCDKESILDDCDKEKLRSICEDELNSNYSEIDNMFCRGFLCKEERETALIEHLTNFSSAKLCVTDRLHGMLFSLITETPCVILNNCNHKLRATYQWVENVPYLYFCDDINEINNDLITKLEQSVETYSYINYAEQFQDLFKVIKDEYYRTERIL